MNDTAADLQLVQRWMQDALIFPGRTDKAAINALVVEPKTGTAARRLAIYQRSYYERLLSCMREQFPALRHALGQELFDDFTLEYLRENPPESYTLYDLGRRLVAHLEASRPDRDSPLGERETWIDFMIDLARFERQIFVMFDAPGHEGKPFATRETPDNRLMLQSCVGICAFSFPVARYYHDVKSASDPEFPAGQTSYYALVRKDFVTRTLELSAWQHRVLSLLWLEAMNVSDALRMSATEHSLDIADIQNEWARPAGLRQQWLTLGFFVERSAKTTTGFA